MKVDPKLLLSVKNLTFTSDDKLLINDITFDVKKGEFIIISGENGSGKTLIARHLNGLIKPASGGVYLENKPIFENIIKTRQKVGLIFQESHRQFVGQTVYEEVAFGPMNMNLAMDDIRKIVDEVLKTVDLYNLKNKNPHELSGGQQRKVAIAGILAMKPEVIVMDEPFTGLDYQGVKTLIKQLNELQKKDHTIIIITHELEKILAHADRLMVISKGKLVLDGKPEEVCARLEEYHVRNPLKNNTTLAELTWLI